MTPSPTAPTPRRRNGRRGFRIMPWLGLAALATLITIGFLPRPTPVEVALAGRGPLRSTINEEGRTRIRQRYIVSAPVAGNLRRIPFRAGAEMKAGDTVVAVIDPVHPPLLDARNRAQAQARRDASASSLEKARIEQQFASAELKRIAKLHAQQIASPQELEAAQLREATASKDAATAEANLKAAELELAVFNNPSSSATDESVAPVSVITPISGKVLRIFEESSRAVLAGTPLVEIGDPADLEVVIETLSRDGAAIPPGTRVELDQWGGADPLQALVRLVEPSAFTKISALGVEEQRVNVVADLMTPASERPGLGDAFRVEARIIVWESEDVLKVPSGALFRSGRQWSVFVLKDGRAALRKVDVGRAGSTETQVLGGLDAGEEVILYPGERIQDGQLVKPIQISRD